jgi:hypothetical protein
MSMPDHRLIVHHSIVMLYVPILLVIGASCGNRTGQWSQCGNNIINGSEQCDGPDLGGQTCDGLGFSGGTLGCTGSCTFDTSGCAGDTPDCIRYVDVAIGSPAGDGLSWTTAFADVQSGIDSAAAAI